jgi:nucleoside-diphosphate-sugar epimerase
VTLERVLVTGAAGFIGRHCTADLVARGFEVHAVSSRPAKATDGAVTWHRADLLDPGEIAALVEGVRPTHLLHLAWETTHGRFWTSGENMRWLAGGVELVRAFGEAGGRRAVIAGSCAEYRWADEVCTERTTPLKPRTLYGACKHALHIAAEPFAAASGVSLAWGRVFFLYGPAEPPGRLVPSVTAALLRGEPAACTHGRQVRDFLYVEDAARAFTALLASDVTGAVNVASGQGVSLGDVAAQVGAIVGRPDLVRLGALPAAADDPALLVADVTRLSDEVGWRPAHDLDSGLRRTIEWWRGPVAT